MTGTDLSPLIVEAVREVAELTAAAASLDEQLTTAHKVTMAFGKILFNARPLWPSLFETIDLTYPRARAGRTRAYYILDHCYSDRKLCIPKFDLYGYNHFCVAGVFEAGSYMDDNANVVMAVRRAEADNGPSYIVSRELLPIAFPSIISSMKFVKHQMKGKDDDLAALWEELRTSVLAAGETT